MNELMSVLSLIGISAFLLFPYNSFRIDNVRQKTFALRDKLFDEARLGNIGFDSPAYGATRSMLNGVIRYSHRISFSRMISFRLLISDRMMKDSGDGLARAMSASSAADRELCSKYISNLNVIVFEHVFSSPFVLIFVIPQVLAITLSKIGFDFAGRIVQVCKQQFAEFDRIAFREGQAS
jgi:hypothetical protein